VSELSLTPISYVVLGLVRDLGPVTPYDMKRIIADSIGYFWPFPHSQLYAEPARLAEAGLLAEEQEEGGRRRKTYTITEQGRRAVEEWIVASDPTPTEIRDLGLLRLFFASGLPAEAVSELARRHEVVHRERLAEYEALYARVGDVVPAPMVTTLRIGLDFERLAVDFWRTVADDPPTGPSR
jgi:DNA-binding PadR family transcriptional regulator